MELSSVCKPLCHRSNPPAKEIVMAQVNEMPHPYRDWQLTLTCLQGLVNRETPQLYLSLDLYDRLWMDWLVKRGDVQKVIQLSVKDIFERFVHKAKGLVVTDPRLPASVNVATMLAGVEDRLLVTPNLLDQAQEQIPATLQQETVDLRSFGWKSNLDAYRWFYERHWNRLSQRMCAILSPHALSLRDYVVAFKLPLFWLPEYFSEEEGMFVKEYLMKLPPNIPCLGWPSYPIGKDPGVGEEMGVVIVNQSAKFEVCSSFERVSRGASNMTLHSGTSVRLTQPKPLPAPKLDSSKIYITFIRTDGDSPDFYRENYRLLWEDPDRGHFPIGWQQSPLLVELMPDILDWYYHHATPNDRFVNSVTGIGYLHEMDYAAFYPEDERHKIWLDYVDISSKYREELGLDTLVTFYEMPRERLEDLCRSGVKAVFKDYERSKAYSPFDAVWEIAGVPVFQACTPNPGDNDVSLEYALMEIRKWTPVQRPAFVYASMGNWVTRMEYIRVIIERLGDEYVPVTPDQLVDLYWQAKKSG